MEKERKKRPRSAHFRKLPEDALSLEELFLCLHKELVSRAQHMLHEPRDFFARRGLSQLHTQRAEVWQKLYLLNPTKAMQIAKEFDLKIPE